MFEMVLGGTIGIFVGIFIGFLLGFAKGTEKYTRMLAGLIPDDLKNEKVEITDIGFTVRK